MFKKIENLIVILVALSAIAIVVYQTNPREYSIRPSAGWTTATTDDRSEGGNSSTSDESTDSEFAYRHSICKVENNNAYGILMIRPPEEDSLFDWRWMESISITAYIEGKTSENYRLQLRSREESCFVDDIDLTLKYNQVTLTLTDRPTTQVISTDKFYVPGWWVERMSLPLDKATPSFDSVKSVEIHTGGFPTEVECRVIVEEIKVVGHWIPASLFYRGILGVWLGFGCLVALSQIVGLRKRLSQSQSMELKLQQQKAELAELATLDPLTQLFNRRGLRPHTTLAMRKLRQEGKPFSLIMFDIDNFKNLNDKNGHSYGDEILQHVALVVSESVTANDPATRLGGEEFLVLCKDGNLDSSTKLAERIRQRIERDIQITCSFGVCEVGPGSEFSEALDLVDECLYEAKQAGKNCVKTSTCVGPSSDKTPALIAESASV